MIESIELNFTNGPVIISMDRSTIVVGPNNSGKSLILREITTKISSPQFNGKIIRKIHVDKVRMEDIVDQYIGFLEKSEKIDADQHEIFVPRSSGEWMPVRVRLSQMNIDEYRRSLLNEATYLVQVFSSRVIKIDGRTRFQLVLDQSWGDILQPPSNYLSALLRDSDKRRIVKSAIYDAFNLFFFIDVTRGGTARIRLSNKDMDRYELNLNAESVAEVAKSTPISEYSDGTQAFVGIISLLCSVDYLIYLIDEPEAFLHPPLARKLGMQVFSIAGKNNSTVIASTHSSDFLLGCIESGTQIQILRTEYSNGVSKGKLIESEVLDSLLRVPLVRNSNVLSSLF